MSEQNKKIKELENLITGKVKMDKSFHQNVDFLNPGDTFLLSKKHWDVSKTIAEQMVSNGTAYPGCKLVVAISGPSGAGKSEIGYCLGAYLGTIGLRSVCYSTDNCYEIEPNLRGEMRSKGFSDGTLASLIGPNEYDWKLIHSIESAVLNASSVETPVVDITKADRPIVRRIVDYGKYDILMLDGIYAIGGDAQVRIFLEQTWDGILIAQHERGKETPNEQRQAILRLEMDAINKLSAEIKKEIFRVSIDGTVSKTML